MTGALRSLRETLASRAPFATDPSWWLWDAGLVSTQPSPLSGASLLPPPDPASGEERLVREAILLVASHGAPRVLVAGIAWGEVVLDRCRRPALEVGVRLIARATARGDRFDVLVEVIR